MENGWIIGSSVIVAAAVGVTVAIRTGWMQSGTMRKCVVLAGIVHVALAIVAALIGGLSPASWGSSDVGRTTMVVVLDSSESLTGPVVDRPEGEDSSEPMAAVHGVAPEDAADSPVEESSVRHDVAGEPGSILDPRPDESAIVPLLEVTSGQPGSVDTFQAVGTHPGNAVSHRPLPAPYADRAAGRRAAAAVARGGSVETEQAVVAGLGWLRRARSVDGRWNAARHGATVERSADGVDRRGSGARCDNGVTALALLAFLGAGSTHLDGPDAAEVAAGIDFLVGGQAADGSLAGNAEFFTALYCHGMATLALAEASAMSGDPRLREPLERAVAHTIRLQHPATGGWRYAAGDEGDTSQLGWQVMALSGARLAGVSGTDLPLRRAAGFLPVVSGGGAGGLACYRPGERFNPTMTAEALLCRLLLGATPSSAVVDEAVRAVAMSPPEAGTVNLYRWYYSTLALYHVGGEEWERWNVRVQRALIDLQRRGGPLDGSWDPDAVWGGHGGRVYSTALSVLTLEVYYRYLPLHASRAPAAVASTGTGP